jgi:mono/diheme cytochrome c family protein
MSMRNPMRPCLAAVAPALAFGLAALLFALAVPLFGLAAPARAEQGPRLGKPISAEDLAPWDISIGPDGAGLPPGGGTVRDGEAVFAAKCQGCHNEKGAGTPNDRLVGGKGSLPGEKPAVKTVGSYWPYATTLFDYIRRAMPLNQSKSLTDDEVYGVAAYLLNLNGIIADDATMNAQTLPKVAMPNREGFVTFARGK